MKAQKGGSGSRAVLLTLLLPPQIRVRGTPDSRHDSDGPEQIRFAPKHSCTAAKSLSIAEVVGLVPVNELGGCAPAPRGNPSVD